LTDPESPFACSKINMGHGSHLSGAVAATRAITEAAQSRLTFIHGAREDLAAESYTFTAAHERLLEFFQRQRGELDWSEITESASGDLTADLDRVLSGLRSAGHRRCYRIDLTHPRFGIPVVKVLVPGLEYIDGFLARHHDL
jgi:ribosomal protein S12 methylthiotransferase accessory factor